MMQKNSYSLLLVLFFSVSLNARDLIKGSADPSTGASFSTPMGILKREDIGGTFYVGAATPGANEFSVARYVPGFGKSPFFFGLTPAQVILNNKASQPSPLYNCAIKYL